MPTLGPDTGQLTLNTTRVGVASRVGHDLTIVIGKWSAEVALTEGTPTSVTLTAALPSMSVTEGTGGLKPLSDSDRESIVKNALKTLKAAKHPDVTFTSTAIEPVEGGFTVTGALGIAGASQSVTIKVETAGTTASGEVVVSQQAFGITPYSAMLGALKVADEVTVRVRAVVPD